MQLQHLCTFLMGIDYPDEQLSRSIAIQTISRQLSMSMHTKPQKKRCIN
jgi:hypothetical protein